MGKILGSPITKIIFAVATIIGAVGEICYASADLKKGKEVTENEDTERIN